MEAIKNERHELTKMTIFDIQVCSVGTEEEALEWIRKACPAGTEGNWQKSTYPQHKPVGCANGGGRTHYVFLA